MSVGENLYITKSSGNPVIFAMKWKWTNLWKWISHTKFGWSDTLGNGILESNKSLVLYIFVSCKGKEKHLGMLATLYKKESNWTMRERERERERKLSI